ncbi:MAG TPA: nuclear transport factor 2 family protein [Actinomycetota bacterium]|nr:nuclear transport factor 2 family protein [Actinomycetota bacterium]
MTKHGAAHALLEAIATRDFEATCAALDASAQMRALLPSEFRVVTDAEQVASQFRGWFGDAEPFTVVGKNVEQIGDKVAVRYRFRLTRPNETETQIEQHLFCVTADDAVEHIDLVCSGFRAVAAVARQAHDFDAGTLGCTDGLAVEFRKRIKEIAIGDLLRIQTVDPSAKEDLPSLARLMGHTVQSIEAAGTGGLTITVERGK